MKKLITILLILAIASFGVWLLTNTSNNQPTVPEETTGNTTEPSQEEEEEKQATVENESIKVFTPEKSSVIESPLQLEGEVRGSWLFEATAPVMLTDWDGRIISEGYIETEGDWMTEDFVPFSGSLTFEVPEDIGDFSDKGFLIFQKANPSGLPEHDDALEYKVRFR